MKIDLVSLTRKGINKRAKKDLFSLLITTWVNGPSWFPCDYMEMYSSADIHMEPS